MTGPELCAELQRVIHTAVAITEGEVIPPEAILLGTSVEAVHAEAHQRRWETTRRRVPHSFAAPTSDLSPPGPAELRAHPRGARLLPAAASAGRPGRPSAAFPLHPPIAQASRGTTPAQSLESRGLVVRTTGPKLGPALVSRFQGNPSAPIRSGALKRQVRDHCVSSDSPPRAARRLL